MRALALSAVMEVSTFRLAARALRDGPVRPGRQAPDVHELEEDECGGGYRQLEHVRPKAATQLLPPGVVGARFVASFGIDHLAPSRVVSLPKENTGPTEDRATWTTSWAHRRGSDARSIPGSRAGD